MARLDSLQKTHRLALARALEPAEALLWIGRPDPQAAARSVLTTALVGGVFLLISVPLAGLGLFKVVDSLAAGSLDPLPAVICLVTAPIALLGLHLSLAPLAQARRAADSVHALTDQRFLSVSVRAPRPLVSIPVRALLTAEALAGDGGTGAVRLRFEASPDASDHATEVMLHGVPDVAELSRAFDGLVRERAFADLAPV